MAYNNITAYGRQEPPNCSREESVPVRQRQSHLAEKRGQDASSSCFTRSEQTNVFELTAMRHKNLRRVVQIRRDYDQASDNYDRVRFGTSGGQYVGRKEQEFVASIVKGSRVLEVGTATGRFAVALACQGLEYTGIDLSRMMLQITRGRTNQSVSLLQMDGCQLGFRSYFNYVICVRTFHFLPTSFEALSGMFAALQPSGKCVVTFETHNFLRRLALSLW